MADFHNSLNHQNKSYAKFSSYVVYTTIKQSGQETSWIIVHL